MANTILNFHFDYWNTSLTFTFLSLPPLPAQVRHWRAERLKTLWLNWWRRTSTSRPPSSPLTWAWVWSFCFPLVDSHRACLVVLMFSINIFQVACEQSSKQLKYVQIWNSILGTQLPSFWLLIYCIDVSANVMCELRKLPYTSYLESQF